MTDQTLSCPYCSKKIPLSEALIGQVKLDLETEFKREFDGKLEKALHDQKAKLWVTAQEKAHEKLHTQLQEKDQEIKESKEKLQELRDMELELRRQKREVEDKEKQLELTMERRLDEMRKETVQKIGRELDQEHKLKLMEKDKQLEQIKRQLEEANRKAAQGSQQIQGDALENDIRSSLRSAFPHDDIDDVPTGITGADLIHKVKLPSGEVAGIILWEIKNTKMFSRDWIVKMKNDQTKTKADMCVLATRMIPSDIEYFGEMDGVFIVELTHILPIAHILRGKIKDYYMLTKSLEGSTEKSMMLYRYVLSPEFKNKIEVIFSTFTKMRTQLEQERNAVTTMWARREKQIRMALDSTAMFYGDLQGVTGDELPEISPLSLNAPDEDVV